MRDAASLNSLYLPFSLVYVLLVGLAGGQGLHGWGAVVGTDTAFMLGTLAIVGPRLSGQGCWGAPASGGQCRMC